MIIALGLIALALGYKVYVDASKEKEGVKLLGQVIGIVVILGALSLVACGVMKCVKYYGCPMGGKATCPITAKANCPMSMMGGK